MGDHAIGVLIVVDDPRRPAGGHAADAALVGEPHQQFAIDGEGRGLAIELGDMRAADESAVLATGEMLPDGFDRDRLSGNAPPHRISARQEVRRPRSRWR